MLERRWNVSLTLSALCGLSSVLLACAATPTIKTPSRFCLPKNTSGATQQQALSIVSGQLATNSDDMERSTLALQMIYQLADGSGNLSSTCTGVVAARNVILTAAHCFNPPDRPVSQTFAGVTSKTSLRDATTTDIISVTRANLHPDYNGSFHDIAVVTLAQDVPSNLKPAAFVSNVASLTQSTPVVLIGYGITGDDRSDSGTKRRTESMLDKIINRTNFPATSIVNQIRVLDTSGGVRGACFGDSGGPGFVKSTSLVFGLVQGINSTVQPLSNMNCSSGDANYTLVEPYREWIETTANIRLNTAVLSTPQTPTDQSPNIANQSTSATSTSVASRSDSDATVRPASAPLPCE